MEVCKHCGGSGYDPHPNHSTSYPICPECNGNNKIKEMTTYEKIGPTFSVGQSTTTYDIESEKWVNGIVEEVGDETILIKWEDLENPIEYRLDSISMNGDVFYDDKRYNTQLKTDKP